MPTNEDQPMKINEMNNTRKTNVKKALKEHFEVRMDFNKLKLNETKSMLKRVRDLITETRTSKSAHGRYQNPAYMKLVMMEQALTDHYGDLKVRHRIMLENEEVQKSQVILAAQDMVDSIQKMVEQISKMKVEELPAVVTGVNNEIGTDEGQQFESTCTESLMTLEQALSSAKMALSGAVGQITGTGGDDTFSDQAQTDEFGEPGSEMDLGGDEELPMPDMDMDEPEEELGGAGRERR